MGEQQAIAVLVDEEGHETSVVLTDNGLCMLLFVVAMLCAWTGRTVSRG